jgi:LuxR family maltose regulon positive regulatory protein
LHIAAALTATERGDQAAAHNRLARARQGGPRREHLPLIAYAGGMLRLHGGDVAVGLVGVEAALAEASDWAAPSLPQAAIVSARATLLAVSGRADEAVATAGTIRADDLHALCPNGVIAFAELNAGQFENARRTVAPCLATGLRHAQRTLVIALVIATLAAERSGDAAGAATYFQRALATAAVTGVRQAFGLIPTGELLALVDRVQPGAEPTISKLCTDLAAGRSHRRHGVLSERERYVLGQLAGDATVAEIAVTLFVSPNTVKTQIRMIYRKLGVASRAAAVAEGRRLSLV